MVRLARLFMKYMWRKSKN